MSKLKMTRSAEPRMVAAAQGSTEMVKVTRENKHRVRHRLVTNLSSEEPHPEPHQEAYLAPDPVPDAVRTALLNNVLGGVPLEPPPELTAGEAVRFAAGVRARRDGPDAWAAWLRRQAG